MTRDHNLPSVEDRRTTDSDGHDSINPLGVAIVTVPSSRGNKNEGAIPDPSGDAIESIPGDAGHVITHRQTVPDDYVRVKTTVGEYLDQSDADIIVTTGGTGVTIDDITPSVVRELFDRELPGFGEAFRYLLGRGTNTYHRDPRNSWYRPECPGIRAPGQRKRRSPCDDRTYIEGSPPLSRPCNSAHSH